MAIERFRRTRHGVLAFALGLSAASCGSTTDVTVLAWEGELTAVGPAGPRGSVALLSQYGRTEASIEIRGALPDTAYAWRINAGTCAQEGTILGGQAVYPALATDGSGTATRDAVIAGAAGAGTYAARVLLPVADGSVVACGELQRVTP